MTKASEGAASAVGVDRHAWMWGVCGARATAERTFLVMSGGVTRITSRVIGRNRFGQLSQSEAFADHNGVVVSEWRMTVSS